LSAVSESWRSVLPFLRLAMAAKIALTPFEVMLLVLVFDGLRCDGEHLFTRLLR